MLLGKSAAAPVDVVKANCAGQGCAEREQCRRYRVRIGEEWKVTTGAWASFDLEREPGKDCPAFRRYIVDRRAA